MIWAVASDAHRDAVHMEALLAALPAVAGLCFLGDGEQDAAVLREGLYRRFPGTAFYAVAGNNDFHSDLALEVTARVGGVKILLTHGHRYHVKVGLDRLFFRAQEAEASAVLFGHTHRPCAAYEQGILLLNPGALCLGAYALLRLGEDGVKGELRRL